MLCYRPRGVNVFACASVCLCVRAEQYWMSYYMTVGCFSHFIFSTKQSLTIENNSAHFVIQPGPGHCKVVIHLQTQTVWMQRFGFTPFDRIDMQFDHERNICPLLSSGVVRHSETCWGQTTRKACLIHANEILSQSTRSIDGAICGWASEQTSEQGSERLHHARLLIILLSFLSRHNNKTISAYMSSYCDRTVFKGTFPATVEGTERIFLSFETIKYKHVR